MRQMSPENELKKLRKKNRLLARQIGQLKRDAKVDVPQLRAACFKEGFDTALEQVEPEIIKTKNNRPTVLKYQGYRYHLDRESIDKGDTNNGHRREV